MEFYNREEELKLLNDTRILSGKSAMMTVITGRRRIGNFKYVRHIVERDFDTYSGIFLEKYFREKLALSGKYTRLGCYWERGNRNELDIVAIDELQKKVLIAEVKMSKKKFRPNLLKDNAQNLINKLIGYEIEYKSLSIDDI